MSARVCKGCGRETCHRPGCKGLATKRRSSEWCCEPCRVESWREKQRTTPEWFAERQYQEAKRAGYAPIPPDELSAIVQRKREGCKCADGGIPNGEGECFKCGFRIITEPAKPKRSKQPARPVAPQPSLFPRPRARGRA